MRIVEGLEGEVPMEMVLDVRFGYGADAPWITRREDGVHFVAGPDALVLRGADSDAQDDGRVSALLHRQEGRAHPVAARPGTRRTSRRPPALDVDQALARDRAYWREWAGRCTYQGRWREAGACAR